MKLCEEDDGPVGITNDNNINFYNCPFSFDR